MKPMQNKIGMLTIALAFLMMTVPSLAQESKVFVSSDDVRAEITEAMEAVSNYSAQERKSAVTKAREALSKLDAEIERREDAIRENWSDMSAATREKMRGQLRDLRHARNQIGERLGALKSGTDNAWDELTDGFADAWGAFADAWNKADNGTN